MRGHSDSSECWSWGARGKSAKDSTATATTWGRHISGLPLRWHRGHYAIGNATPAASASEFHSRVQSLTDSRHAGRREELNAFWALSDVSAHLYFLVHGVEGAGQPATHTSTLLLCGQCVAGKSPRRSGHDAGFSITIKGMDGWICLATRRNSEVGGHAEHDVTDKAEFLHR